MRRVPLPIDPLLPEIVGSIERNTITLLRAEPGAGKTTRVPPALLEAGLGNICVLEPRRLAVRMAARRVAHELNDEVGGLVGYRVRFEEAESRRTRIWYVTEGILTRKLLGQGLGREIRTVVLDEFHERHLETDLALALLRRELTKDKALRVLIMSATLAGEELCRRLGGARLIEAPGRTFPVEVRYTPYSAAPLEEQVASAVRQALEQTKGSVLVFLPGAGEIRKAVRACEPFADRYAARVLPLHGDLSSEEQDLAVGAAGRKVICSTNIAESSLTIDGVQAVVDSGLANVMRHSSWSGLSRLVQERVSRASAIQRAGRAGRTSPGLAIRLFGESDFLHRPNDLAAEILRADLSQLVLQVAAAGIDVDSLDWLDPPPRAMLGHARDLLKRLSAFDEELVVTQEGRRMAAMPVHPRLARLASTAASFGASQEGCTLAAKLAEGRIRKEDSLALGDYVSDLDLILQGPDSYTTRKLREQLLRCVQHAAGTTDPHALEKALLFAFPDRVGRRRGETVLLSNGANLRLEQGRHLKGDFLTAIEVDQHQEYGQAFIRMACDVEPDWLLDYFPERVHTGRELRWNREAERIDEVDQLLYDELVIEESSRLPLDNAAMSELMTAKVLEVGIEKFADSEELAAFLRRIRFAAGQDAAIGIPSDLVPLAVGDLCNGLSSFAEVRAAAREGGFLEILQARLPMRVIEEIAPRSIQLPGGRKARVEYHDDGQAPSVASRLQDFFGMKQTPTIARGGVPLVVKLLAPNHRPVQVTTDLVSFWKNLYPQVRRELSRRYPKHFWPEAPV